MVRLFEFCDLDAIMNIWLEGNLKSHSFISDSYWRENYDSVKSILPNAEVYVHETGGEVDGFIGIDADYIEGIFVAAGSQRKGIGHQLIEKVKKERERLSLHVYQKNRQAIHFYEKEGFRIEKELTEKENREPEYLMVYAVSDAG